jgi:hypothetical protein
MRKACPRATFSEKLTMPAPMKDEASSEPDRSQSDDADVKGANDVEARVTATSRETRDASAMPATTETKITRRLIVARIVPGSACTLPREGERVAR